MIRFIAALVFLCVASSAHAFDCSDIRMLVKALGKEKAIELARKNGATEEQINTAITECLRK